MNEAHTVFIKEEIPDKGNYAANPHTGMVDGCMPEPQIKQEQNYKDVD